GPEPTPGSGRGVGGTREEQHEQEPQQSDGQRDGDPHVDEEHDQDPAVQVLDVELLDVADDSPRGDVRLLPRLDVTGHARARTGCDAAVERDDVVVDASRDQDVSVHDEDAAGDVPANRRTTVADEHTAVDGAVDDDRAVERQDGTVHDFVGGHDDAAADADASVAPGRAIVLRVRRRGERYEDDCCLPEYDQHFAADVYPPLSNRKGPTMQPAAQWRPLRRALILRNRYGARCSGSITA